MSAGLSRLRVRKGAGSGTRQQKAHRGKRKRTRRKSEIAKRETQNRRKTVKQQVAKNKKNGLDKEGSNRLSKQVKTK